MENLKSGQAANETAEKILTAIYGADLHNCHTRIESIGAIIQETLSAEIETRQVMLEALIEAIRKIQLVATPPAAEDIQSMETLANVLGQRADAIRIITTEILRAWEKAAANLK
ncbi:MAG: hypothetical protein M3Y82_02475 [Verrucomicrobiota bacterium]|nr:hypothetical protein [Verrucomicrobiota bacterium]